MSFSILLSLTQADEALPNYNKLKIYNITQLQNHPYCILYICLASHATLGRTSLPIWNL